MIQIDFELPDTCGECPLCIYTADEKRYVGYCNTSDEDYYCKALQRFMEYDKVDGGLDILGKPSDCPLKEVPTGKWIEHKPFERNNCNKCIECSVCKVWLGNDCYAKTNFCPMCGSRMVEE